MLSTNVEIKYIGERGLAELVRWATLQLRPHSAGACDACSWLDRHHATVNTPACCDSGDGANKQMGVLQGGAENEDKNKTNKINLLG